MFSDGDLYVLYCRIIIGFIAIMRFKKGNKVEVMNKKEALTSWRFAEIISGNGHTYGVRYDCSSGKTREEAVERVSRKAIRPIPPQLEGAESWLVGDIVEVFDEDSWKIATVLKDYDGDYYLVRALGMSFRVHKLNIRTRQSWQNDKWVVIGKVFFFICLYFLLSHIFFSECSSISADCVKGIASIFQCLIIFWFNFDLSERYMLVNKLEINNFAIVVHSHLYLSVNDYFVPLVSLGNYYTTKMHQAPGGSFFHFHLFYVVDV